MIIKRINRERPDRETIEEARSILEGGGVVAYPTDTIYGLAVNALDEAAIKRLFKIKQRSLKKPISICLPSVSKVEEFAKASEESIRTIEKILPGPYTVILKRTKKVPDIITAGSPRVGIRVPDSKICALLSQDFPITSTSANISGKKNATDAREIRKELPEIDMILDAGPSESIKPSTVIDFTKDPPQIIRKGAGLKYLKRIQKNENSQ